MPDYVRNHRGRGIRPEERVPGCAYGFEPGAHLLDERLTGTGRAQASVHEELCRRHGRDVKAIRREAGLRDAVAYDERSRRRENEADADAPFEETPAEIRHEGIRMSLCATIRVDLHEQAAPAGGRIDSDERVGHTRTLAWTDSLGDGLSRPRPAPRAADAGPYFTPIAVGALYHASPAS